jgi:hypothetical protein
MSDLNVREIIESPWEQGADESRSYTLDTGPWGGSPSSPVVKLYVAATGEDVTAGKLSGSATVSGDDVVTPAVSGLAAGGIYRLEIRFVTGGRTEEAWGRIVGTR